jgi:hypothetical protein
MQSSHLQSGVAVPASRKEREGHPDQTEAFSLKRRRDSARRRLLPVVWNDKLTSFAGLERE